MAKLLKKISAGLLLMAAIDVAGADRVSLGSDFDGSVKTSLDVSELVLITSALSNRGVPDATIAMVMCGNAVAFFQKVLPLEE